MLYIPGAINQADWLWAIDRVRMKLGSIEAEADCFGGVTTSIGKVQKRTN